MATVPIITAGEGGVLPYLDKGPTLRSVACGKKNCGEEGTVSFHLTRVGESRKGGDL